MSEYHQRVRLNALHLGAGLRDRRDSGSDGVLKDLCLAGEIDNDVTFLKGDGRIVATGIVEARVEILRLRIEAGNNDAEFISFHRGTIQIELFALPLFYLRMILSENRFPPSDQVRGQAFSGSCALALLVECI